MDFLLRYFSLILIAGVLVNAVVAHRRIPAFVAARGGGAEEPMRFVWGGAAVFAALFIALNLLVHYSSANEIFCFVPTLHPRVALDFATWAIWFGWVLAICLWIWLGNGANIVARNAPLFARSWRPELQYTPAGVRVFAVIWCVSALAAPLILSRQRPAALSCSSATVAYGHPNQRHESLA